MIRSKVPNEQYKENFDRIFRKTMEDCFREDSEQVRVVSRTNSEQNMLEVSGEDGGVGRDKEGTLSE